MKCGQQQQQLITIVLMICSSCTGFSFIPVKHFSSSRLHAGFGAAAAPTKTKKKSSAPTKSPLDLKAALQKSEILYDEYELQGGREAHTEVDDETGITTNSNPLRFREFVLATKSTAKNAPATLKDWIPISYLCILSPVPGGDQPDVLDLSSPVVTNAVRTHRLAAVFGAENSVDSFLSGASRQNLIFAIEPIDDYQKFVHDKLVKPKGSGTEDATQDMTRKVAREILGVTEIPDLDSEDGAKTLKNKYRKLSMKYHPDSNPDSDATADLFNRVKVAYEVLSINTVGYENLGGKERNNFKVVELGGGKNNQDAIFESKHKSAILPMMSDNIKFFMARNSVN
ncbi:hypothetical protein ScalyP_jg4511 [Parmales sp. scaly parma]|nr:hypothetical protein ScalyP_jg4511 [Parmales sp. scaly parma]